MTDAGQQDGPLERLLEELRLAPEAGSAADDPALVRLRTAILVEQVFALTLTEEQLDLDLTDETTLRAVVGRASVRA